MADNKTKEFTINKSSKDRGTIIYISPSNFVINFYYPFDWTVYTDSLKYLYKVNGGKKLVIEGGKLKNFEFFIYGFHTVILKDIEMILI